MPLTTSCLHGSFDKNFPHTSLSHALTHFSPLSLVTMSRRPLFNHSYWSPKHMAVYNFIQLISIPGTGYVMFATSKITHYTAKILLDFVEICSTIHCYTISISSLYAHVHILCTLYQNLTILEINLC